MIASKNFALYGGIALLALGLISAIPNFVGSMEGLPTLNLNASYGLFLDQFPMNIVNKIVLTVAGITGILVSRSHDSHAWVNYSRTIFFAMGLLALLGIPEATNTLGGYYPLFGNVILVNALFALIGGYCGFVAPRTVTTNHYNKHTHA